MAVQVDPITTTLKAPGTERLKLKYDSLLQISLSISTCGRYGVGGWHVVGRCRLTVSKPELKAPVV